MNVKDNVKAYRERLGHGVVARITFEWPQGELCADISDLTESELDEKFKCLKFVLLHQKRISPK